MMLTTALLPQSAPLEPMHAQYVPVLTDIAPLLLIRELPQDEYPTPALPRPFTSHDVEPVMFGPNISGRFEYHAWAAQRTGAFYEGTSGVLKTGGNTDRNSGDAMTRMDASRVTSAYGNSSTVQPSSLRLVHCIKS